MQIISVLLLAGASQPQNSHLSFVCVFFFFAPLSIRALSHQNSMILLPIWHSILPIFGLTKFNPFLSLLIDFYPFRYCFIRFRFRFYCFENKLFSKCHLVICCSFSLFIKPNEIEIIRFFWFSLSILVWPKNAPTVVPHLTQNKNSFSVFCWFIYDESMRSSEQIN